MTAHNKTTLALLAATLCGGSQLFSMEARAAPAATPGKQRSATIWITRQAPGTRRNESISFTVALAEDRRPSRLALSREGAWYKIGISHDQRKGSSAVVHLNLRCNERRPAPARVRYWRVKQKPGAARQRRGQRRRVVRASHSSTEVSLSSRVTLGQRTLLGRIQQPGGVELRVSVELK